MGEEWGKWLDNQKQNSATDIKTGRTSRFKELKFVFYIMGFESMPEFILKSKSANNFANRLLGSLSVFTIVFFTGLIVSYTSEIFTGETPHGVASQLGLIVFLFGIILVCLNYLRGQWKERKAVKEVEAERLILGHAKAGKGIITVSAASLECGLSISNAKKTLERLAMTGVCHVDVSEQGELVYCFPSFESKPEPIGLIEPPAEKFKDAGQKISLKTKEGELDPVELETDGE